MKLSVFELPTQNYNIPCKLFEPENGQPDFVVVGVHGFAGDKESSVLTALAESLCSNRAALICFDFPAHGHSRADDCFLRVNNCKNDLLTVIGFVIKQFPQKKYGLFATSFGGYISLLCAKQLVNWKIVLRAPAVTMAETFIQRILPISKEDFLEKGGAECGYERTMFVSCDFYRDLLDNKIIVPPYSLMIIHGTNDDIVPYQAIHHLSKIHNNIKLVSIEGANHRFKRTGELECIVEKAISWYFE